MKVIILCGGVGSRLAEETKLIPKPMVKIGNKPILSHIMKIYEDYGFNEFIFFLHVTSIESIDVFPQTPQLELVKKFLFKCFMLSLIHI